MEQSFTPARLVIYGGGVLSLLAAQLRLHPHTRHMIASWRRIMTVLVLCCLMYDITVTAVTRYRKKMDRAVEADRKLKALGILTKLKDEPDPWDHESAHPSTFLTTREAKPRLFPFPLGKAGGQALKGELWWEAGNSAHVGHFNRMEMPEAKAAVKKEMVEREKARRKRGEQKIEEYEAHRKKWIRRLAHLKILGAIVIVSLFNRMLAICCLVGLLYWTLYTELMERMKLPEEKGDEKSVRRKKIPNTPGMAMTYLYEPSGSGVKVTAAVPTKAPSHRLMTSTSSRYAS